MRLNKKEKRVLVIIWFVFFVLADIAVYYNAELDLQNVAINAILTFICALLFLPDFS